MIPKKIHYCWFGGNPLPESAKKYIETWKKYCPDYEIIEWNENNFDVTRNQYCKEAYEAKKWAFVSDYARLKVLYDFGGIYMDTDVEVVRPLDDLLQYNWFSGFESEERIPTGTMGAGWNSTIIKIFLDDYKNRHFIKKDGSFDLTTNVEVMTQILKEKYKVQLNNTRQIFGDNNMLLPFDYLCCKSLIDGKIYRTKNTYTIHHFEGTWVSGWGKFKQKVRFLLSKIFGKKFVEWLVRIKKKVE